MQHMAKMVLPLRDLQLHPSSNLPVFWCIMIRDTAASTPPVLRLSCSEDQVGCQGISNVKETDAPSQTVRYGGLLDILKVWPMF